MATKREQEENDASARAGIAKANEIMVNRHRDARVLYKGVNLIENDFGHVPEIARKMSKKFTRFKFSVGFLNGIDSLSAEPVFEPFDDKYNPITVEANANKAVMDQEYWVVPAVLRAYALGYQEAAPDQSELRDLKKKLERYENEMPRFPFHPAMMRGWGPGWRG
jgi:hypothetical protein